MSDLKEAARPRFVLSRRLPSGETVLDQLLSVERQTGMRPAQLHLPPIPEDIEHVWAWWEEISLGRTSNGWSLNPISWVDIDAWSRLTGRIIWRDEVLAIMEIDLLWRSIIEPTKPPDRDKGKARTKAGRR